ncbi:hypothetical protein BCL76_102212 [Streptomyces sp. CG 926]|nr:hypothetical protein BCL76_102212 [Streptomyces sp. CG 926]
MGMGVSRQSHRLSVSGRSLKGAPFGRVASRCRCAPPLTDRPAPDIRRLSGSPQKNEPGGQETGTGWSETPRPCRAWATIPSRDRPDPGPGRVRRANSLCAPHVSASDDRLWLDMSRPRRRRSSLTASDNRPWPGTGHPRPRSDAGHAPDDRPAPNTSRRPPRTSPRRRPTTVCGRAQAAPDRRMLPIDEASGPRPGRKGVGLRLFRGGCGSARVGGPEGWRLAPITPVWARVCGVVQALTRSHDRMDEPSAARPSRRNRPSVAVRLKRVAI